MRERVCVCACVCVRVYLSIVRGTRGEVKSSAKK